VNAESQSALHALGARQRELLEVLQRHKAGCTADEVADELRITRTAVRQHLAALERDRYVTRGPPRKTAGRPGFVYELTAQGRELFPRRYSWFSSLLLESLRERHGEDGLADYLRDMAANLSARANEVSNKTRSERVASLATLMNELGYDAEARSDDTGNTELRAYNCVYHHLAEEFPALCAFDVELIRGMSGHDVEHAECMVRGGRCCRFRLISRPAESAANRAGGR
jgi:predicted ArsR family transcriptional regulator